MIRNRNGYWMSPAWYNLFPDNGAGTNGGGGTGGDGANGAGTDGNVGGNGAGGGSDGENGTGDGGDGKQSTDDLNAKIARMQAEMAKQKAALDKATHEAGEAKKALKAKMTQEEIDAAAKQEAEEKAAKELDELRREVAKGKTVKTVMGKLGLDEETAGNLADHLYGAADIDNALLEIQKAWQAKEAELRKEFGKIPGPGFGKDSDSPEARAIQFAAELGKNRNEANKRAQEALGAYMR